MERATLRFRPPTPMETAAAESGAGFIRTLGGLVQLPFLAVLVLAARSRGELLALTAMFLAGQIVSVLARPDTGWRPAARFEQAATAAEMIAIAIFALVFSRLKRVARGLHPVEVSASALLAFGMVWFVLRLRN